MKSLWKAEKLISQAEAIEESLGCQSVSKNNFLSFFLLKNIISCIIGAAAVPAPPDS
jgi:primosomal protein N''